MTVGPAMTQTTTRPTTATPEDHGPDVSSSISENAQELDPDEDLKEPIQAEIPEGFTFVDLLAPLHGFIFKDESVMNEEQFAWTLVGILISLIMGQFKWITKQAVKLILRACPRLHATLRQVLGMLQIVEEVVQEIDSETLGCDPVLKSEPSQEQPAAPLSQEPAAVPSRSASPHRRVGHPLGQQRILPHLHGVRCTCGAMRVRGQGLHLLPSH